MVQTPGGPVLHDRTEDRRFPRPEVGDSRARKLAWRARAPGWWIRSPRASRSLHGAPCVTLDHDRPAEVIGARESEGVLARGLQVGGQVVEVRALAARLASCEERAVNGCAPDV